ncbi:glycosyltransferase [Pedobacter sp. MW01-1-1]|uniref:glycosyltransferase n=1 Tax=Pedobacter sp. MW01-1-1 TaxID=3383027 RepID=UPI003FEEFD1E
MSNTLIGRDIIIVGQQPWDTEIGSNCKNIAVEFSKNNRVLYVNSPLDRATLYRDRDKNDPPIQKRIQIIENKEPGLIEIQPNLWNLYPNCLVESINWVPNTFIFSIVNWFNNRKLSKSIKEAIKMLSFKDIILFNDSEMLKAYYLDNFLKPSISIYYSRDYMLAVDYWKKHGENLEPKLIAKSDICVANSMYLAEYCQQYNPNSYYVGQGCDFDILKLNTPFPNDLENIKRPIIGYVGALQSIRLDIEIIEHLAQANPDWSIVLVGPEDDVFKSSGLHRYQNIIFTGPKPVYDLSIFINAFDVCINPQLVNQVTIGNYPRKIDEYLALGKPVVATKTKAMEAFSAFVYLSENKDEYAQYIKTALEEDSVVLQEKRREFALTHTWENSVNEIYKAIHKLGK